MRRVGLAVVLLLFSFPAFSQEEGRVIGEIGGAPSGITEFNRLIRPQFRSVLLGPPARPALNAGVGNGVARIDGTGSFFCSGLDEANAYRSQHGLSAIEGPNSTTVPDNMGTYQFVGIIDHCRDSQEVAENFQCGGLEPDDLQTVIGFQTHAATDPRINKVTL